MSTPAWSSVDEDTADLLTLVAEQHPAIPSVREEWTAFVAALHEAACADGVILPNDLRPLVRGRVAPQRISAFTRKALLEGLVEYTGGYQISDDTESRNGGKPCRCMRLLAE